MSKIQNLDTFKGLRGLATLVIIISQSYTKDKENKLNLAQGFSSAGHMAIYFIFVLSSFLFSYKWYSKMLPKHRGHSPDGRGQLSNNSHFQYFSKPSTLDLILSYIKIIFKVYPLYIVAVLFYGGFSIPKLGASTFERLFMLPADSYSHLWAIRVGFCYALLMPVFQILSSKLVEIEQGSSNHAHKIFLGLLTLIALCINAVGYVYSFGEDFAPLWQHFPVFWYGILSGIIYFYLERNGYTLYKPQKKGFSKYGEIILYGIFGYIALTNKNASAAFIRKYTTLSTSSAVTTTPLYGLFLIFLALTEGETSLGRFFCSNLFVWTGKHAYSIYLTMFVPITIILNVNIRGFEAVIGILALALLTGLLFNKLIEANGIKIGNSLISKLGGEIEDEDETLPYNKVGEDNRSEFLTGSNDPLKRNQVEMVIAKKG